MLPCTLKAMCDTILRVPTVPILQPVSWTAYSWPWTSRIAAVHPGWHMASDNSRLSNSLSPQVLMVLLPWPLQLPLSRALRHCLGCDPAAPAAPSEQRFEQWLAFDPAAPALEELELSLNEAGVGGARALADAITGKTRLKKLNLSENELEDRGALLIAKALKGLRALQVVDLTINQVGDHSCQGSCRTTSCTCAPPDALGCPSPKQWKLQNMHSFSTHSSCAGVASRCPGNVLRPLAVLMRACCAGAASWGNGSGQGAAGQGGPAAAGAQRK